MLKAKELSTTGVKQELIDRLIEAEGSTAATEQPEATAEKPAAPSPAPAAKPAADPKAEPAPVANPAAKPAASPAKPEAAVPAAKASEPTPAPAADAPSRAEMQVHAVLLSLFSNRSRA